MENTEGSEETIEIFVKDNKPIKQLPYKKRDKHRGAERHHCSMFEVERSMFVVQSFQDSVGFIIYKKSKFNKELPRGKLRGIKPVRFRNLNFTLIVICVICEICGSNQEEKNGRTSVGYGGNQRSGGRH